MNSVRPFKFEKSAFIVAEGDDKGLNIAQLAEKYSQLLYGTNNAAVEQLQGSIGKIDDSTAAQDINVDDHYEMDLHGTNECALLQVKNGKVVVTDNTGREHHVASGESLLIPAATTLAVIDGHGQVLYAKF